MIRALIFLSILALTACEKAPPKKEEVALTPASFKALSDWGKDDMQGVREAFERSCIRILKRSADKPMGALSASGTAGDWHKPCEEFLALENDTPETLKAFFETHFTPYQVSVKREGIDRYKFWEDPAKGLFTGYYEASLRGSLTRTGPYQVPLYARPDDLVMVQLGDFRDHLKGERIAGRVVDGNLKPYEAREEIVEGKWPHNDKALVWVDSAVDAFFVQIQGSGVVELAYDEEDPRETLRVGYAGQNGHPYYAIGRELIKRGEIAKEDMSLQAIRKWLEEHPEEADAIMNTNRSYVFFRELNGEGPIGGEGIPLTGGRSLAIDRSLLSYGLPLWVDIDPPLEGEKGLRRLMIAQDTGGAIRGPVRGDVFWGYGDVAEYMAGHMKSEGRYWVLLPKSLSPSEN